MISIFDLYIPSMIKIYNINHKYSSMNIDELNDYIKYLGFANVQHKSKKDKVSMIIIKKYIEEIEKDFK
jgi:endonuclease III